VSFLKELGLALALMTPLVLSTSTAGLAEPCADTGPPATVDEVVSRLEENELKYVFIGENHSSGSPKRLAVELTNRLVDRGYEVGLYVEGFRTDCPPGDDTCPTLARLFNAEAFSKLLTESRAPVRALDPPEMDRRAQRMAATIASGQESIRVVLAGRTHIVHAEDPAAEVWIFGGAVRYPDPGDLVEAFPRGESLTIVFDGDDAGESFGLRVDGCRADYALVASTVSAD
jgi:hypothetical protein